MAGINKLLILLLISISGKTFGQISAGKIVFERKTNLEKKFKDLFLSEPFYLKNVYINKINKL